MSSGVRQSHSLFLSLHFLELCEHFFYFVFTPHSFSLNVSLSFLNWLSCDSAFYSVPSFFLSSGALSAFL